MAYKLVKKYPDNFSKDIIDVVDTLSLKHGEEAGLYGSARFKLNYPSDYDFYQEVEVSNKILSDIQEVVRNLLKLKNVFIGDIKSGMIPELKVIEDNLNENNYNSSVPKIKDRLKTLYNNKNIDKEEYKASIALLKPNLNNFDISILKHELRFEVIRWSVDDILKGFTTYRNIKINFYDYLISDSVTKIDALAWVNGIRFNEITIVYILKKNGEYVNRGFQNLQEILKDTIPYLLQKGKIMKVVKRINAIERLNVKPDNEILHKIFNLTNGDLGRINQIISDITVLRYLIENIKNIPKKKFQYEIDMIKYRLGAVAAKSYNIESNLTYINKLLNLLEKDVINLEELENLEDRLFEILQSETIIRLKRYGLYPVPKKYLPSDKLQQNEKIGEGMIDTLTKAINYISNMFPSSDKNATIIEPDEKHGVLILPNGKIGRSNYMGPGTNLIKRLKRGDKPRTEMDELSRAHDIRYDLAQSQKDIEDADEIFIKGAKKIRKNKLDNRINTYVGQIPIQAKLYAERKGLVKPTFKQINKFEKDDEKLLRDTLKTAIMKGYGIPSNKKLYETIKKQVYIKYPKHSAYRSMLLVKEYKKAGGKYYDDNSENKMNTKKWLGQKWTSLNDYHHNNTIVKCGNSNTKKKFNEYPVCRPLSIIKKLSHPQMQKLIDEKNILKEKPLISSKILKTNKFNIKNTVSGMGQDKISMSKKDLLKEHQRLIKVLKSGNKKEQIKEAISQQKEIEKYCDCPAPITGYGECGKIPYKF